MRDRMVVFGGRNGSVLHNDVWALSLTGTPAWAQLTPTGTAPNARQDHSAIYDPVRDRMVVFGGGYSSWGLYYGDVWALSLAGTPAWTQLTPTGRLPSARLDHSAIYDPMCDRMAVFGGTYYRNDLWALWLAGTPTGVSDHETRAPIRYLRPPNPNPFNGTTALSYSIAQAGRVQLGVYDVRGRLVRKLVDGERHVGAETVVWDGTSDSGTRVGTGVYFIRLVGPGIQATRQAVLLK